MNAHNDTVISNYIESRLTKLETTQESVKEALIRIEQKLNTLDSDVKVINSSIGSSIKNMYESLNNRLWHNFYWTIGSFAGTFYLLAKLLKWIS